MYRTKPLLLTVITIAGFLGFAFSANALTACETSCGVQGGSTILYSESCSDNSNSNSAWVNPTGISGYCTSRFSAKDTCQDIPASMCCANGALHTMVIHKHFWTTMSDCGADQECQCETTGAHSGTCSGSPIAECKLIGTTCGSGCCGGAVCNNGFCGTLGSCLPGARSCSCNSQCCSGNCSSGQCTGGGGGGNGSYCNSSLECSGGYCCNNVCASSPCGSGTCGSTACDVSYPLSDVGSCGPTDSQFVWCVSHAWPSYFGTTGGCPTAGESCICCGTVNVGGLTAVPTVGVSPLSVNFTMSSDSGNYHWWLRYGDETGTNDVGNPNGLIRQHTYTNPGNYWAILSLYGIMPYHTESSDFLRGSYPVLIKVNSSAIGYLRIRTSASTIELRLISVADALTAGRGMIRVRTAAGTTAAADLVLISDVDASPVRVMTPGGIRSWRKKP